MVSLPDRMAFDRVPKPYQAKVQPHGQFADMVIHSPSAGCPDTERLTMMNRPDQLIRARFVSPSTIKLRFADGRLFSLAAEKLGMPMDQIDWPTVKASPGGEKIVVKGVKGDRVPIDSATLRYLVDNEYAAMIDKSIRDLHLNPVEQEEVSRNSNITRDPRWYDVADEDDLCE